MNFLILCDEACNCFDWVRADGLRANEISVFVQNIWKNVDYNAGHVNQFNIWAINDIQT